MSKSTPFLVPRKISSVSSLVPRVQEKIAVGTNDVRQQQLILNFVHGIRQQEPSPTARSRKKFSGEPGNIKKGVEPAEVADRVAENDEIPRAILPPGVVHDIGDAEVNRWPLYAMRVRARAMAAGAISKATI